MRALVPSSSAAFLVLLSLLGCGGKAAHLAGRVVAEGGPLGGASVVALDASGALRAQVSTESDGSYRFTGLPSGSYRLRAESADHSLVAVPGPWFVKLAAGETRWVGMRAVPDEKPAYRPLSDPTSDFGALSGIVQFRGRPLEGAVVYLYLGDAEELKGPGFRQSMPTGETGEYSFEELPEAPYFVAVRKRAEAGPGPLREGDLHGVATSNPVEVRASQEVTVTLHLVRKEKDEDPNLGGLGLPGTSVRGRVVDDEGRPVSGVYVFGYRSRTIGHGMPDFASRPTGSDGEFELPLGDGGLFYVGARERTGGSPAPGERFGLYEGAADHSLEVTKGAQLKGVTIHVARVLEP